jgi:hypothetical protein
MRVLLVDGLEAFARKRRALHITDRRFDLPLQIGRVWPARKRNNAVVLQQLA